MAVVTVRIYGREYHVACDDGQEEHLRLLADEVDDRVRALNFSMGNNPGELMSLLLASLTMADELLENKREMDRIAIQASSGSQDSDSRLLEMEAAMAGTLDEIAARIEKIADQIS